MKKTPNPHKDLIQTHPSARRHGSYPCRRSIQRLRLDFFSCIQYETVFLPCSSTFSHLPRFDVVTGTQTVNANDVETCNADRCERVFCWSYIVVLVIRSLRICQWLHRQCPSQVMLVPTICFRNSQFTSDIVDRSAISNALVRHASGSGTSNNYTVDVVVVVNQPHINVSDSGPHNSACSSLLAVAIGRRRRRGTLTLDDRDHVDSVRRHPVGARPARDLSQTLFQ